MPINYSVLAVTTARRACASVQEGSVSPVEGRPQTEALAREAAAEALQLLGYELIVVDAAAMIRHGASALRSGATNLALSAGRVIAANDVGTRRLHRVIRSASQSHAGLQPVQISPGTSVLVGRLPDSQFVILLARQSVDDDASVQLTDAETRLLVALVRGERLAAYAQRNAIKLTTAKTHLQALFGKSGQRRQADLIRWALSTGRFGTTGTD